MVSLPNRDKSSIILDDELITEEALTTETPKKRGRPKGSNGRPAQPHSAQYVVLFAAVLKGSILILSWRLQYPVLLISDKEAEDIARPAARIFARSKLAKMYGRYVMESNDYVALGMACFAYGSRVWEQTQQMMAERQNDTIILGSREDGRNQPERNGRNAETIISSAEKRPNIDAVNLTPHRAE